MVKRVLLYRLGSLGDHLVSMPCYRLVQRAFPDAEMRLLTNVPVSTKAPAAAEVLDGTGLVQGYLRYTAGTRSVVELAKLWWSIARFRPDVLVYLAASRGVDAARRDERFFGLCGVKRMIGVPLTEAMQHNFYGMESAAGREWDLEPEAERLARCIGELGDARLAEEASWDLSLRAQECSAADDAITHALGGALNQGRTDAIAVSVGTKVQAKDWGKENWRALLAALAGRWPGRVLLLVGAPEEAEASASAATGWTANGGGPVANLCGKLTPRQSAAALARARMFVGHDSGPMHLAAAAGTPVVAVFAARNIPRVWFPFGKLHRVAYHRVDCAGCGLETCIVERKKCLLSITVDEVVALCEQVLGLQAAGLQGSGLQAE
jgi:heptosyltransferase-3